MTFIARRAEDYQAARQVCADLDMPLHRVNFAGEYRREVFAEFLRQYHAGRTPNPDVLCQSFHQVLAVFLACRPSRRDRRCSDRTHYARGH